MKKFINYTAVHKPAKLFGDGSYRFLYVGAAMNSVKIDGAIKDDEYEDNISLRNNVYCELTGYYHIWKHEIIETVGFCHYRRYFASKRFTYNPNKDILKEQEILDVLNNYDIILSTPNSKRGRRHGCFPTQAEVEEFFPYRIMRPVIDELYPDYLDEFNNEFFINKMSFFNMFVCRKQLFDDYCKFLFDILFKVEENLKKDNIGGVSPRELGFFSEWLLNVWVRKNKLKVCYKPVLFIDENKGGHYFVKFIMQQLGLISAVDKIEDIIGSIKNL